MRKKELILKMLDFLELKFKTYKYTISKGVVQMSELTEQEREIQEILTEIISHVESEDSK
jgi:hypothetical protein